MSILISNRQDRERILIESLRKKANLILNALGCPEGELSLVIVDEAEITQINREYFNRPGPTNVISFAMNEGEFADVNPQLLGDVIICADTARKEAETGGLSFDERFDALLIHGILHLFGYDHEHPEDDAAAMEAKADELQALIRG